ncbi:hypothetical protein GIB67_019356 [Kingdonia uniflora]|uniref:Uncharacterized protein n=1 Tax=Kingdonia uniflora TaxID=39325 RepID=A0A7J7M1T5_9MAGN|nr:hypothetical protein GIB67_019356 [Kingdonia uniflora]
MGKRKWTAEEIKALAYGVLTHGTSKWKKIKMDTELNDVLSLRSNVDLKNKWSNMIRTRHYKKMPALMIRMWFEETMNEMINSGSLTKESSWDFYLDIGKEKVICLVKTGGYVPVVENCGKSSSPRLVAIFGSEDILQLTLLRLPWQSVTRFMSVSKRWHQVISSPSLVLEHELLNYQLLGFYRSNTNVWTRRFVPFIPLDEHREEYLSRKKKLGRTLDFNAHYLFLNYLECCNGLILHSYHDDDAKEPDIYLVHNPIADTEAVLPVCPESTQEPSRFNVFGLAFEPSGLPPHFKVLNMFDVKAGIKVNTFSSITKLWSSGVHDVEPLLGEDYILSGSSIFYKGALHWLLNPSGFVAYNIKSRSFTLMKVPGDRDDGYCFCKNKIVGRPYCVCRSLVEYWGGCLAYTRVTMSNELSVWVLEDYYRGKWAKSYNICLKFDLSSRRSLAYGKVVCFNPKVAGVMFINIKNKIFACNTITGELKELLENIDSRDIDNFLVCPYHFSGCPLSFDLRSLGLVTMSSYCHLRHCRKPGLANRDLDVEVAEHGDFLNREKWRRKPKFFDCKIHDHSSERNSKKFIHSCGNFPRFDWNK